MIFAGFSLAKLFGGFALWKGDKLGKFIQQVVVILIVLSIIAGVWFKLFGQRTEHTEQHADQITNIEPPEKDGFNLIKIKILGWGN